MALTKEQIEKMDAALGKKASSPAQYAQRSNAAYTGGLSQDKFSQMDRLLTKRAVASRPSSKKEEEEKDALGLSTKWYKNPIGALSRVFVDTFVKTAAKPFGEVVASSYELAGKEAPQWTEANRLASPELRSLKYGLGTDEQRAEMERLRQSGAQGAGFTDVLNVASLLPAGGLAKVAGGTGLLSKTARVLPKGIVGKGVETGAGILKGAAKSEGLLKNAWTATKAAAPAGTGWGAAYGLASSIDERKSVGETAASTLGGAATGLALGTGLSVAGAGLGSTIQKAAEVFDKDTRMSAIASKNKTSLQDIINANAPLRRQTEKSNRFGIDPVDIVSKTDLLVGAVDKNGKINTTNAVNDVYDLIRPYEGIVGDILKAEGRTISKEEVRAILVKNLEDSGIAGGAKTTALKKIDDEIAGLALDQNPYGRVSLETIHKSKVTRGNRIKKAYLDPDSQEADKLITRSLKEIIENNTQSADVKAINKELQNHYEVIDFLKKLDRKIVKGGRAGKYFAQTFGSIAGSKFGPLGAIAGAEIGGKIHGNMLAGTFGKQQGRGMAKSKILRDAKENIKNTGGLIPESRRLPEPAIRLPYNNLGNRNTTQSTTIAPTMRGISRTVAQNTDIVQPTQSEIRARLIGEGKQGVYGKPLLGLPSPDKTKSGPAIPLRQGTQIDRPANVIGGLGQKTKNAEIPLSQVEARRVDLNDPMSIEDEISRRIDEARQQYGTMADRRGAGARPRAVEDANGNFEFSTNTFNVNRAKKDMRTQADFYKAEMHEVLYNQDETFRKLVDAKDKLLEKRVNALSFKKQDEDFERSVNELFGITEDEIKNIQKAQEANKYAKPYEQPKSIAKTPATVTEIKSTPVESQKQSEIVSKRPRKGSKR